MNEKTGTGVSSEKEKVKESQSRNVTPSLDTHFGCRVGGVTGRSLNINLILTSNKSKGL